MTTSKAQGIVVLSTVLWLSAIGVGRRLLWSYENSPGNAGVPPSEWPEESLIKRTAGQATLVMFAHPRCPCIPGVTVLSDEEGKEFARFNATTSGATLLYESEGRLRFSGGITGSRGHSGDNPGRSALVALLNQQTAELSRTPVFGCPLVNEHDGRAVGDERCTK